jgi:hypothetical protein
VFRPITTLPPPRTQILESSVTKTVLAAVTAAALLVPAAASAQSGSTCPSSAKVLSGQVVRSQSDSPAATRTPSRNIQYVTRAASSLTFGSVRLSMPSRTTFTLGCAGKVPRVELIEGRVDLRSRANRPGIVRTREADAKTANRTAQTMRVSRSSNLLDYGPTSISRRAGKSRLVVTPKVGASSRKRIVRAAKLTSQRLGSDGRLEGTTSYTR